MADLRGYTITDHSTLVRVKVASTSSRCYNAIPTVEECNDILGTAYTTSQYELVQTFQMCQSLLISPPLPPAEKYSGLYLYATSLQLPPVITSGVHIVSNMFNGCQKLLYPASIPTSVTTTDTMFQRCYKVGGEMIIRPTTLTSYTNMFQYTSESVVLYGDQTLCEALAATANNNNVSWSAWYDPVTAVTDRGQGSRTTAADITRMVRNGALAVSSYCPARMVYSDNDIIHEDEWLALVEAAQTIDATITASTHYENLNKIEAAFDSAL